MFKRMLKKVLLTVLTLALLVGVVLGVRWLNASRSADVSLYAQDETVIPNESLTALAGDGLQLVEENDHLQLYVNFDDGNIEVVNKANGYVWRSCPTAEEMALQGGNAKWKNILQSPFMFTYVTEMDAANIAYSSTREEEAVVTVYKLERGVRVCFKGQNREIELAYEACLDGDRLAVSLPSGLIRDPGVETSKSGKVSLDSKKSCIIAEIYLFPSFGATRSDMGNEGALLVPDGTGALIDFNSRKFVNSQYIAPVYGGDMSIQNGYDSSVRAEVNKPRVTFPVYGVLRDGNTLLAIIDEGETQSSIVAYRAGVQTGFNTVSARFNYRLRYKTITNSSTGDGYQNYTEFAVAEPRRVLYCFGTGTYVDMAGQYREYLAEKNGLTRLGAGDGEAALQLNIVGGDVESGMLGDSFIAMTTFDQAAEMLEWFSDNGVADMDVVYSGWGKRGESVEYPARFPAAGALGGNGGLKAFAEKAKALNADVYLLDDHVTLNSTFGLSVGRNTVYNIQGNPLYNGAFANSAFMASSYADGLKTYRELGVSGLQERGAGRLLMTDYAQERSMSREDVKDAQRELLRQMVQDFGSVRLAGSSAYTLMDHAVVTDMASSSYLTMLDESIPFYTIAMHGQVEYLCGDYMDFYEQRSQLLEAIARGGSVSFTLTWENTGKLALADTAAYYSTTFEIWRDDVLAIWQELEPYLKATRGQYITGHDKLAEGVTLTTYENGVQVLVNNTDRAYQWNDTEVAPRDFLMKGE